MKVKLITTNGLWSGEPVTLNKVYEVAEDIGLQFRIIADNGKKLDYNKGRFRIIGEEEYLEIKLKEAKQKVKDLEDKIEEINKPKVGQRYKNKLGSCYVLAEIDRKFALVSYEGSNIGGLYGHTSHRYIDDVFNGCKSCFTLIK